MYQQKYIEYLGFLINSKTRGVFRFQSMLSVVMNFLKKLHLSCLNVFGIHFRRLWVLLLHKEKMVTLKLWKGHHNCLFNTDALLSTSSWYIEHWRFVKHAIMMYRNLKLCVKHAIIVYRTMIHCEARYHGR